MSRKMRSRVTEPLTPAVYLNASAWPAALESAFDSVAAFPTSTVPAGGGGGAPAFDTVTVTDAALAVLPAASRATAVSACVPFATVVVSHAAAYGAALNSAPRFAPSSLNCTPTTPTLSAAVAVSATDVPETVDPEAGAVSAAVGGVVSDEGGPAPPFPLGTIAI